MPATGSQPGSRPSLPEVHASVATARLSIWRRMFAFAGPAYLVSVGYMDPGNWATDIEGGARFGYQLLWVLVMSNLMAILLQTLSARLGIVNRRDLAQACRETYPRPINLGLWVLCELAIAACDLAEVLGAAIGLNLLFGLPLLAGVFLTAFDTLLLLGLSRFGIRVIESFVLGLVTIIALCFLLEMWLVKPSLAEMAQGLWPRLTNESLYVAIGMLGATVMPHNLYLHSALVQTRRFGSGLFEKRAACRFNLVDSVVALNGALLVNASILVMAAALFFKRGIVVTEIQQAHTLLEPLAGHTLAGVLFAVALVCSGQSSTMTGTMAGQIVMEGFLSIRLRPWLRRLLTRAVAIIPAALTVYAAGDRGTFRLLILSQVILSMQLPFAIIPLVHFTSDRKRMGAFVNRPRVRLCAWAVAAVVVALNIRLVGASVARWLEAAGQHRFWLAIVIYPAAAVLLAMLLWVSLDPWLPGWLRRLGRAPLPMPAAALELEIPAYRRILVPVDHTGGDHHAIAHAAALARSHGAKLHLLHVEEDVTSLVYGDEASTAEVEAGQEYLGELVGTLSAQGVEVEASVVYARDPAVEIVRFARRVKPDLVVMGSHGHKGLEDLLYGKTIDGVRHSLDIPVLVVRRPG